MEYLDLVAEVGFPIVGAGAAGYFVYLTLNFIKFYFFFIYHFFENYNFESYMITYSQTINNKISSL